MRGGHLEKGGKSLILALAPDTSYDVFFPVTT